MRSEEEIGELTNALLKIVDKSPEDSGAYETYKHYLDCLSWVTERIFCLKEEKINPNNFVRHVWEGLAPKG